MPRATHPWVLAVSGGRLGASLRLKREAVVDPRLAIGRILGTPFEGMKIVAKTRSTAAMSPRPARSGRGERRRILAAKW